MSSALAALASSQQSYGPEPAGAVDLDGTNDYFSRASDLTGNADGKTFTFSAWVYVRDTGGNKRIYTAGDDSSSNSSFFGMLSSEQFKMQLRDSGLTVRLNADLSLQPGWNNTWVHFLVSLNIANTSQRYVFVNDIDFTGSVSWVTYSDASFDWTQTNHRIGRSDTGDAWQGRLAHVYLDKTYRDLSNSTNRRLFVTANLKPADGQASLNPILYLPLTDPTQPGLNSGTGGNFTLTGTIARSGRGPNQYNAPYSDLDGAADYLSRATNPTGVSDSKTITFHCVFNTDNVATTQEFLTASTSTTARLRCRVLNTNKVSIVGYNSSAGQVLNCLVDVPLLINGRNYVVDFSCDLSDTNKRHIYINGAVPSGITWVAYTDDSINLSIGTSPTWRVGADGTPANYFNGRLGAVWFNTSYIDLSQASNLAKFVTGTGIDAKPVDLGANGELPTGTSPLIYLPMYGNNAGKNYGTGGDFTVNAGPYTGARGPNEFWGNKADFDGSTGYLSRTSALTGVSNSKELSMSIVLNADTVTGIDRVFYMCAGATPVALIFDLQNGAPRLFLQNSGASQILAINGFGLSVSAGTSYHFLISVNLATSTVRIYVNDTAYNPTPSVLTNDFIAFASCSTVVIGESIYTGTPENNKFDGKLSEFYFTTSYIDFSQEANRLLFRDAFGNPTNLPAAIQAGTVPNPAIYMRFDPASFGANSGTGGNFTVNGTITDGGQL